MGGARWIEPARRGGLHAPALAGPGLGARSAPFVAGARARVPGSEIQYAFALKSAPAGLAPLLAMAATPTNLRPEGAEPDALPSDLSYEGALAELEQLVARMEAGSLPLDQLLGAYRRGAALLEIGRAHV